MDRLIATHSVDLAHADTAPVSGTPQYATDGNPGSGIPATIWPAYQYNSIQEELLAVIEGAGLTPSKGNLAQVLQAIRSLIRLKLTGNLDLYVATTGSDSNNGLSPGTPFLTLQKAWNYIVNSLDLSGFSVTVHVAAGTYSTGLVASGIVVGLGSGNFILFTGDTTTPANCLVTTSNAHAFSVIGGANILIAGFKFLTSGSVNGVPAIALVTGTGGLASLVGKCEFGACARHMHAENSGSIIISTNYTISGGADVHIFCSTALVNDVNSTTVTLTGSPAFSLEFANSQAGGLIQIAGVTFSGSATGARYLAALNGLINTQGAGVNYLPGNAAGSTTTGGQYT